MKIRGMCRPLFCEGLAVVLIAANTDDASFVLVCCDGNVFLCKEGFEMHDFILDGLGMAVISLFAFLMVTGDGLGMAVVGLAEHFGTVDGLGRHDFFIACSAVVCCDGLVMGLCLGKLMVHK